MHRDPTPLELYMSHQQGQEGVLMHLRNPNQAAWRSMCLTTEGRAKGTGWCRLAIWGNIPTSDKRRFGSVDNVRSKDLLAIYEAKITGRGETRTASLSARRERSRAPIAAQQIFAAAEPRQEPGLGGQ